MAFILTVTEFILNKVIPNFIHRLTHTDWSKNSLRATKTLFAMAYLGRFGRIVSGLLALRNPAESVELVSKEIMRVKVVKRKKLCQ